MAEFQGVKGKEKDIVFNGNKLQGICLKIMGGIEY